MTSGNGETASAAADSVWRDMGPRYFYGWNVVGATFAMALWSFGLGFYGLTVYVAALQHLHGWSAATVSTPVMAYYLAGALVTVVIALVYQRLGPRVVVGAASVAMAGRVGRPTSRWRDGGSRAVGTPSRESRLRSARSPPAAWRVGSGKGRCDRRGPSREEPSCFLRSDDRHSRAMIARLKTTVRMQR